MKKRASYKVFGFITAILVISALSIALLGNVGQGQETQSSDTVFIAYTGRSETYGDRFTHSIITVHPGTEIVVLNAGSKKVSFGGLLFTVNTDFGESASFRATADGHGVIYVTHYDDKPVSPFGTVQIFVMP